MTRRSVLVTGAGHGIGRAVAELFAHEGWVVGLYDVDVEAVERVRAALPSAETLGGRLDVAEADGWDAALRAVTERTGGRLDVLVNNAGVLAAGPFTSIPLAEHRRLVEVNLGGVVNGCAAAFPYLRRGSCVVNVASGSALYGQPGLSTYSATKAAICALTEALDLEWEQHGIRVRDVVPLFVRTRMLDGAQHLRSLQTLGVHLEPSDVAQAVRRAVDDPLGVDRVLHGPHRAVGWQARLLSAAAGVGPQAVRRSLVALLAR